MNNGNLRWLARSWRRARNKRSGYTTRYSLELRDGPIVILERRYSATQLRAFADIAVDALEGHYGTYYRFESSELKPDLIGITEHRESKTEHMTFSRNDLEDLIAQVDSLLGDM